MPIFPLIHSFPLSLPLAICDHYLIYPIRKKKSSNLAIIIIIIIKYSGPIIQDLYHKMNWGECKYATVRPLCLRRTYAFPPASWRRENLHLTYMTTAMFCHNQKQKPRVFFFFLIEKQKLRVSVVIVFIWFSHLGTNIKGLFRYM